MFDSLIGNDEVKSVLRRLVRSNRFPQSTIFAGQDGIGKKSFALEIARGFVCKTTKDFSACNECSACQRSKKFNTPTSGKKEHFERVFFSEHPDIGLVIPNKQTIYINAIRELEREANYRPYEAKSRFIIIDEAEKMSAQASNALLKTLEEPAETTHIFLVTSQPTSLLPTINSRCQTIRFAPVASATIEKYILEKKGIPSQDAKLVSRLSRGSVLLALETDLELFRKKREKMLGVIESLSKRNHFTALLRATEELNSSKNKDDFSDYISILQQLIHDLWSLTNKEQCEIANIDILARIEQIEIPKTRLVNWLSEIESLRGNLRSNINRKIATDALFMKMAG